MLYSQYFPRWGRDVTTIKWDQPLKTLNLLKLLTDSGYFPSYPSSNNITSSFVSATGSSQHHRWDQLRLLFQIPFLLGSVALLLLNTDPNSNNITSSFVSATGSSQHHRWDQLRLLFQIPFLLGSVALLLLNTDSSSSNIMNSFVSATGSSQHHRWVLS